MIWYLFFTTMSPLESFEPAGLCPVIQPGHLVRSASPPYNHAAPALCTGLQASNSPSHPSSRTRVFFILRTHRSGDLAHPAWRACDDLDGACSASTANHGPETILGDLPSAKVGGRWQRRCRCRADAISDGTQLLTGCGTRLTSDHHADPPARNVRRGWE